MASAAEVLSQDLGEEGKGYLPVSAVVIVAAIDPETGQEHLFHRTDTDASVWKHIGMIHVVLGDMMADCRE